MRLAKKRILRRGIDQSALTILGQLTRKPEYVIAAFRADRQENDAETRPRSLFVGIFPQPHTHRQSFGNLLVLAMRQPSIGHAHRPTHIHLRGHPLWKELFPHLEDVGIEVTVHSELPQLEVAFQQYLQQLRETERKNMVKSSAEQATVAKLFPNIAKWIDGGYGHIEIGDQEGFGFITRALEYGGLVCEDDKPATLAEAMAALEKRLGDWFEENK